MGLSMLGTALDTAQHSTAQHSTAQLSSSQPRWQGASQHSTAQHSIMCCRINLDELSFSQHLVRGRQAWGVHNVQVCLQVPSGQVARLSPHLGYLIPAQVVRAGSTCTCTLSISTKAHRVYSETPDRHKDCGVPAANSGMSRSSPCWCRGETIWFCVMPCASRDGRQYWTQCSQGADQRGGPT